MTDAMFEALLRRELKTAAAVQAEKLTALAEEKELFDHPFSRRFERRMAKMKKDPLAYARRYSRSPSQRALRKVALVLAALGLSGAMLLAFPKARAAVWRFIQTVYETHTEYAFAEPAPEVLAPLPTLHANWLPDGYEETTVRNTGEDVLIEYRKDDETLLLKYAYAVQGYVFAIDNDQMIEEPYRNGETEYTLYHNIDYSRIILTWFSEDGRIFYQIRGSCGLETLIKVIDNLSENNCNILEKCEKKPPPKSLLL